MRRKTKAHTKQPVIPRADARRSTGKESYHLRDTMASESYKLQINYSCITSITRKSTMEWQGLKHALECLILNFDGSIKNLCLDFKETMCLMIVNKNMPVKRFHSRQLARPIDSKQHTPIKLIGLLLDKVKIKGINPMIIPFG
jgi:hypothetical protein